MNKRRWMKRCAVSLGMALVGCAAEETGADGADGTSSSADAGNSSAAEAGSTTSAGTSAGDTSGSTSDASSASASSGADGGAKFDLGMGETGSNCEPMGEEVCNGFDDDCDGAVDDVDVGGDGICDCLSIGVVGGPGSLSSSTFTQWLEDRGTSAERIDPPMVDGATLAGFDVIILDQLTREYSAQEVAAFVAWVEAGGGLMALTGHIAGDVVRERPNAILAPFGMRYEPGLLNGPVTDFEAHPLTEKLTSVTFTGGFAVGEVAPGPVVIASLLGAGPVARAAQVGQGRVYAWGDEWIEYDSEWASIPEIEVFWTNVFDRLAPQDICGIPPG